tara:strand:- start:115 stop:342 length:228 start_codon:yes stop_codon:yes gene_type:complete
MTWLELYNFLHKRANTLSELGTVKWNEEIVVHNAATGEEDVVDIWELSDPIEHNNNTRLTLVYNQLEYETKGDDE